MLPNFVSQLTPAMKVPIAAIVFLGFAALMVNVPKVGKPLMIAVIAVLFIEAVRTGV